MDTLEKLQGLQAQYLAEAEALFGPKINCEFEGVIPGNVSSPKFLYGSVPYDKSRKAYMIIINLAAAEQNYKDGIFQLSHEIVHLLSPVKDQEKEAVNYLEEGMATYFSKLITDRDTDDNEFAANAISQKEQYHQAYKLYFELHQIDENAVKKLREVNPSIPSLSREDFIKAGLELEDDFVNLLLKKF